MGSVGLRIKGRKRTTPTCGSLLDSTRVFQTHTTHNVHVCGTVIFAAFGARRRFSLRKMVLPSSCFPPQQIFRAVFLESSAQQNHRTVTAAVFNESVSNISLRLSAYCVWSGRHEMPYDFGCHHAWAWLADASSASSRPGFYVHARSGALAEMVIKSEKLTDA